MSAELARLRAFARWCRDLSAFDVRVVAGEIPGRAAAALSGQRNGPLVVFLAHPISGAPEANLVRASAWIRWAAVDRGVVPVAPYFELVAGLYESREHERLLGIELGLEVLARCDELWLCGNRITEGMAREAMHAFDVGVPVLDWTWSAQGGRPGPEMVSRELTAGDLRRVGVGEKPGKAWERPGGMGEARTEAEGGPGTA